ncbi:hypothetical protein FS749_004901 [Ceratobasidium sp. UAMH 11750]|nr:hypothetical protein FS749_004901 [Ceratobasidium sp. UAMH 11750]
MSHVHRVRKQSRLSLAEEPGPGLAISGLPLPAVSDESYADSLPPSFYDDSSEFSGSYDEYLQEKEPFLTIPGPQLPGDPVDAIYDDYGGDLSLLGEVLDATGSTEILSDTLSPRPPSPAEETIYLKEQSEKHGIQQGKLPVPPPPSVLDDPEGWLPWNNESDCLLTALSGFPRALYSQPELEVLTWFTGRLGVTGLSSLDQLRAIRKRIAGTFGSNPRLVTSAAGNVFSHNSLSTIIAHEMANPITAANLATFPEDAGPRVASASHSTKWREEVKGEFASPMAQVYEHTGTFQDYFVNEPSLARIDSQVMPVLVTRWFTREGSRVANVHRLIPLTEQNGYAVDAAGCLEVPEGDFHLALPGFRHVYGEYGLPPPDQIIFLWPNGTPNGAVPWNEPTENPWRIRAKGKEVIAVPLLGYCDDTSGNSSKKWNKHNSYLFVLAGLPRKDTQSPYHVHFLATSNIASPLEMLEAIAKESEEAAEEGIWAYSAAKQDTVLCIPWWLGLEGDNPMQSELSSHVGMTGKFFCRVCQVKGKDKQRVDDLAGEKERLREFMNLDKFMAKQFTASDDISTSTGVKDKYLGHFIGVMKTIYNSTASSKRLTAHDGRQLLQSLRNQYPERLFNPALYLPGIDVTQDTPVEVLHVVLLGIVKYFWRDVISRLDNRGRAFLTARLNSFDTRGLGIPRLDGKVLVQYAKSLTGGNFRNILQVAPAVLYDLVDPAGYNMWLALCRLAPLVFQPEIQDIDAYIASLEARIDRLLLATVMCNPRWFNKPKFHVLLHLPRHVTRFGPPTLFATETFESTQC